MSKEELEQYRQFFWANDKDGDGLLSKTEFLAMLQKIGLSLNDRELEGLFQKTDKDGTGKISFHEFAQTFLQKKTQAPTLERIKEVYMINDRNKDGFLDRDECFFALKQLGHVLDERGLQRVTRLMDKNGDGRISFQGRSNFPGNIYLLKANNLDTRKWCEICSKLTIKTPERRQ